jgi:hypothetical protein
MAQLQKGTTYITGDQVTAANLNSLVDSGILTPGAVTDQTAKTVPLAADTILLHSAADTALRKTTMTQLFATPQPLGATTPSSVAATTGTFSGTLGVTGVATLGNGAILGTPASGTVTNLTGTASININGTVGATTAAAGSFTTLSATGTGTIRGALNLGNSASTGGEVRWFSDTTEYWRGYMNSGDATFYFRNIANSAYGFTVTSSATPTFNITYGATVGAGLAVTGTLSCTTGANFATSSGIVGIGTADAFTNTKLGVLGEGWFGDSATRSGSSVGGIMIRRAGADSARFLTLIVEGSVTGTIASGGSGDRASLKFDNDSSGKYYFATGGADRLTISTTGVAVVGTLSATADVKAAVYGYFGSAGVAPSASNPGFAFSNPLNVSAASWSAGTATTSLTLVNVYNGNGIVGTVVTNGSATAWNTSSDARLKTNLRDITNSSVIIDALKPRRFDWLTFSKEKDDYGFVAQEAYEVYPKMVTVGGDDPAEKPWGMDASKLIPVLVAELQSLRKRLAALESK